MCGIIGYVGGRNAVTVVLEGLRRLEYRGYDSAGVAFFSDSGIEVIRREGKLKNLTSAVEGRLAASNTAIGHTRWATHGKPTEENAHPQRSGDIVVVHNGIIENYLPLKKRLSACGHIFSSDTDTEVLCHLISDYAESLSLEEAVRMALREVRGTYALGVMSEKEPGKVVGVRKDSPLVVGLGDGEYFIASDVPAFLNYSRNVMFLGEGEIAILTSDGVVVTNLDGEPVRKDVESVTWSPALAEKGGYSHFMLKEIFEQPRAVSDTLRGRFSAESGEVNLEEFGLSAEMVRAIDRIFIVACGTSWHAGLAGKYMIEELGRVAVEVDVSSEFRYRSPLVASGHLVVVISQSGETADTVAAQRQAKRLGAKVLSICNVIGSTSAREADAVFYTRSGQEIGVASTKAFLTQVAALYMLAVGFGAARGSLSAEKSRQLLGELLLLPGKIEKTLSSDGPIRSIAEKYCGAKGFIYLGRGINYPIALEGALKLKEVSYVHAEGYPAGEMKHGPIALIDSDMPVVVLASKDALLAKMTANIQEVRSRGGVVIAVATEECGEVCEMAGSCVVVPEANPCLAAALFAVPLQLLAYHIGVLRGCDVDQPRNLAKSVTVE